jgi:Mg-chelatase subunit ChlD
MSQSNALIVVTGSIEDMAKLSGSSLAESFLNAEAVLLVDCSGSMSEHDSRDSRQRYDVAVEELSKLQAAMPGKLAVIGFSNRAEFFPGGIPAFIGGSTDLAGALKFAKMADIPGMRFIVISDGEPDDAKAALAVAATYGAPIDTIFVGPENDYIGGRAFLQKLATACRGQAVTADRVVALAEVTMQLLSA